MTRRSPRYLSANGPINPRTSAAAQDTRSATGGVNLAARQRGRAQLGPGLRRQPWLTRTGGTPPLRRGLDWLALSGLTGGLALAVLHGTWLWLVLALVSSGAWLVLRARARDNPSAPGLGLGAAELDAFDRLLAAVAGELTDAQRAALRQIKTLIVEIAGRSDATDAPFAFDDQLYAIACVRRYVPDSLSAFVAVPVALRGDPTLASGNCAEELLMQQLELLRSELQKRRLRAARGAVGPLLRQQRFLETQGKHDNAE